MPLRSQNHNRNERGFTFLELLVSMTVLVVILVMSMSLLFGMKLFAERQQRFAEPRQTARRALDYIASYARTATDMNVPDNPNSLVMWYKTAAGYQQSTFNNFRADQADLGDPGTDAITMAHVVDPSRIHFAQWNGPGFDPHAANQYAEFLDGCDGSATQNQNNMRLFMEATGCHDGDCTGTVWGGSSGKSEILSVIGDNGSYGFYQITGYQSCDCNETATEPPLNYRKIIHVTATPGQSDGINPPGPNIAVNMPASIAGGLLYYCFRVKNQQLQQRMGLFPVAGTPIAEIDASFVPLLDNVEDFQIAYIFRNGEVWNNAGHTLNTNQPPPALDCTVPGVAGQNIPGQKGPACAILPGELDILNVRALRLTVVARSPVAAPGYSSDKFSAPTVEDSPRVIPNDRFYHHRMSATIMLRNRVRGG